MTPEAVDELEAAKEICADAYTFAEYAPLVTFNPPVVAVAAVADVSAIHPTDVVLVEYAPEFGAADPVAEAVVLM